MSNNNFQSELDKWERLLEAIVAFQSQVDAYPVVGGTAAAIHVNHRFSMDADYVRDDLSEEGEFERMLDFLEARGDWSTNRFSVGKIILGNFQGVETGIRQLIRKTPLEVESVQTPKGAVCVPTLAEMIRIKAWLCLVRNATRDYIDLAALTCAAGREATIAALARFDECYQDIDNKKIPRNTLPSVQLSIQLADPKPGDIKKHPPSSYRGIREPWNRWEAIREQCQETALALCGCHDGPTDTPGKGVAPNE